MQQNYFLFKKGSFLLLLLFSVFSFGKAKIESGVALSASSHKAKSFGIENSVNAPVSGGGILNVKKIRLTQKYVDPDAFQQVAEIEAYDTFPGANLALSSTGAVATASSVLGNDTVNYGPQKANDGIVLTPAQSNTDYWHSNSPNINEFIDVTLPNPTKLNFLRIRNRLDCCFDRGQKMLLELFDSNGKVVYAKYVDLRGATGTENFVDVDLTDATPLGSTYTLCVDGTPPATSVAVKAGQYINVNVVQGFTYSFSVGNIFANSNETLTLRDDADVNLLPPSTGETGTAINNWTATISGVVKVLLTGSLADNESGAITLTVNSVGNSFDSQIAFGTDQWIGHVYNWTGTSPPGGTSPATPSALNPFIDANYAGYYNVGTETINETFGGGAACFSVLSNGVVRTSILTETFAVRYRMTSTRKGYFYVNTNGDDGIRVYVDGKLIVNEWKNQGNTNYCNNLVYLNGTSSIILDYYENGGGNVVGFSLVAFDLSSNVISGGSPLNACSGSSPGTLVANSYAQCAASTLPNVSFQWQVSSNNATWVDITSGGTSKDYVVPAITSTTNVSTYYRRLVKSIGSNDDVNKGVISNVITVNTTGVAPIGGGAAQVCVGKTSPAFTNPNSGGTWSVVNGTGAATIDNMGIVSGVSVGTVTIFYTVGSCSVSTSINITTVPAIVSSPYPSNAATGVCGSGGGAINAISWAASATATSYDVYFGAGSVPTTVTANVATNSYTTGSLALNTTYYWRVVAKNACGDAVNSSTFTFTTSNVPCYCKPTISTPKNTYINSFKFVGTLNDNANPNTSSGLGYSDYTNYSAYPTLTPLVKQPQGSVLNIVASAVGLNGQPKAGYWKAWVDYNNDGIFSNSEQVYNLVDFTTESLTFGFVIPSTTPVGKYRFRIKIGTPNSFDSCSGSATGETEDYLFEVIADCPAKINTSSLSDIRRCGTGTVTLSATGTGTGIKWYDQALGGTLLYDGASFVTPILTENTRTTYYVVAYNTTCESAFRIPVTAIADPGPAVTFNSVPAFCAASTSGAVIAAASAKRLDILLYEPFNSGLGSFIQSTPIIVSGSLNEPKTYWLNEPSPYIPKAKIDGGDYEGLSPALSSGYFGGNFVMSNTDFNRSGELLNRIETPVLNTINFLDLNLDLDLYYFTLITASDKGNYFSVDYSLDGTNWNNLKIIYTNQGNPNIWQPIKLSTILNSPNDILVGNNLPSAVLNSTTLKFRFSSYSFGKSGSFKESIAAIDNVKISGYKDESSLFGWNPSITGILYDATCTNPLNGAKSAKICIKPTPSQIEDNTQFSITAQASFSNGCPAVGTIVVNNDAKIWNTASTTWDNSSWKPGNISPDLTKCITVKQPVNLPVGIDGFGKNLTVLSGGNLDITGNLTLKEFVQNQTSDATKLIVESDANLVQIDNSFVNTGDITAKKNIALRADRQQYNYLISPLIGQSLSSIYPNIDRVLYYRESNNYFYTSSGVYIPGRGLAVKVANTATPTTTASVPAIFKGVPANGVITYPLAFTNSTDYGYNLVGNPYPSNINLDLLYNFGTNSAAIQPNFYFWDNLQNLIYQQQGTLYSGISYAMFNAVAGSNGTGIKAPDSPGKVPGNTVKVGQGFIVRARAASQNLTFDNLIRTSNQSGSNFYGRAVGSKSKNSKPDDRFWLEILTPNQITNSSAVVYFDGGKDALADDDTKMFEDTSDGIYTVVEGERVAIQGKATFVNTDILSLSTSQFTDGLTTIKLTDREGVFATGQNIYLKDKATGMVTNLTDTSYTFQSVAGSTDGRFEIMYQPEATLSTGNVIRENLWIYREANDFVVKAGQKMKEVSLYDASGRLIFTVRPLSKEIKIAADKLLNGVFVLKINLSDGEIVTRKIRK